MENNIDLEELYPNESGIIFACKKNKKKTKGWRVHVSTLRLYLVPQLHSTIPLQLTV